MTKTALITGATGGIGGAMARAFAAGGYKVFAAYNTNKEGAQKLCAELQGEGHRGIHLAVDDADSVRAAFAEVEDAGGISVLINNAGVTRFVAPADLDSLDDELIDTIFRVHVRGALACARAAAPMLKQTRGCIINITSVAAQIATGSNIAYCAAKAALNNITLSLARALAPEVRVNALAPGLVDTDFIKNLDEQWRKAQIAKTPLQQLTTPQQVAQAALTLADNMPACTGMILAVDGGRPLEA